MSESFVGKEPGKGPLRVAFIGTGRMAAGHVSALSRVAVPHAVGAAYEADPLVHQVMTTGAWREIQWAQRVVSADADRIESPLLFLLAGEDRVVDAQLARAFADSLKSEVQVRWYPEMYHEILLDPRAEEAMDDMLQFLRGRGL